MYRIISFINKKGVVKSVQNSNYDEAYKLIFEYIETFYNTMRTHSHCNYQSPNQYEKNYAKKQLN